jgi:signal transduction histidine kinase
MAQLIDGLLTLSRSTRGELRRDQVDLSALALCIRSELERLEPGRRVQWLIEPGLSAQGDGSMIEVVLRNLLGNAWKYTCRTAEPAIRVYSELEEGERMFRVADNGAGFDPAHAGKLFQPFQRLHRQDEFPGIGIGLATAQRIVCRHGGVLRAAGTPGGGATFSFSLPGGEHHKGARDEHGQVDTAG